MEVLSVVMPVLPATDVVIGKLRAMTEHYCDFAPPLAAVRAVREQVDWPRVRRGVGDSDFAAAFLVLVERLGIADPVERLGIAEPAARPAPCDGPRWRAEFAARLRGEFL